MAAPHDRLIRLLERLDSELDPATEAEIDGLHRSALSGESAERLPLVVSCVEALPEELEPLPLAASFVDPEAMLFNELVSAWDTSLARRAQIGDDLPATVRANFGTILVASCFGAPVEVRGDDPPWARHLESKEAFARALDTAGPTSGGAGRAGGPTSSWVERAAEFMVAYREILAPYDNLRRVVKITLPDLQGPLDSAAMLRGGELFLDAVADPELFRHALDRMADAQIDLWQRFRPLTANEPEGFVHQHGVMVAGNILIRDDSSVMISPTMYSEQVAPAEARVLEAVRGGAIHSCGSIDHVFDRYLEHDHLQCVDYGQSWMNDVNAQYERARRRGVSLARVRAEGEELISAAILDRFPTGVVVTYSAESVADGERMMNAYREAAASRVL